MRNRKRTNFGATLDTDKFILIAIGIIFSLLLTFKGFYAYGTTDEVSFTVEEKERIVTNNSSKYVVWTDKGVYQNTDSWFYLKFDSSDVYGKLEEGEMYHAEVYGWRVPFFSWYPNIIDIKPQP